VKVAYYSPLPPERSGIADYSALLLPALERLVDVVIVRRGSMRPVAADVALYHVGNDPEAHGWIVDALRRRPGVVALHDFVLHHLVAGLTLGRKDGRAYLAAMERQAGIPGRLLAHGVLEGRVLPPWETRPEEFPLAGGVLADATGLIVHSHYVEEQARGAAGFRGPIWRIGHPAWPTAGVVPERIEGRPLFGCFGHLNASKRLPQLLDAFAVVRRRHPEAKLLLVGPASPRFDPSRLRRDGVERIDYVPEDRLWSLMAACDACVMLRSPTMGETSGSAIRALSLGRPLVVSDVGWFAELPDDVALKVPVDQDEVPALAASLELLASSEATQRTMSDAAEAYVAREHDLGRAAERYVAALEEAAGGPIVADRVVDDVARAAAAVGVEPGTPFATELAERLDELGLALDGRPRAEPRPPSVVGRIPVWAWLVGLVIASIVVRYGLSRRVVAPWIMVDELIYSELAKSFAAGGHFLVRGHHTGAYGIVYPILIAPAWRLFSSVPDAYAAAKTIDAIVMSLTAIPAYFLARRVVPARASLVAAALAVAVPSMAYTGTLMTENAFYPLFVTTALAFVMTLERPTLARYAFLLVSFLLTFLTRTQAVAVIPALATAPLLLAWFDRRPLRIAVREFKFLYAGLGAAVVLVLAVQLARGKSPYGVLGQYGATGHAHYHANDVLRWLLYHVAELDLYLGVIPFAALLLLLAIARSLDRPLRVFVAAAVPLTFWLALEVAAFASVLSLRVEERNLFYVAPLFLIALLAWIERGLPRATSAVAICAVIAAALPGALPYHKLIATSAESDTLALLPLWWLQEGITSISTIPVIVVAAAALLGVAFLTLPSRYAYALPVIVLAWFVFTTERVEFFDHGFAKASVGALFQGQTTKHRDWVDRAVGRNADVAFLYSGIEPTQQPLTLWENEFFNRSIGPVYDLRGRSMGGLPETKVERRAGVLTLADGHAVSHRYVLTDTPVPLVGTPVARDVVRGMVLLRTGGPLRLYRVTGLYPRDTWSGRRVVFTEPRCDGGSVTVGLASDPNLFHRPQTVTAGSARVTFAPAEAARLTVPLHRRPDGTCRVVFRVSPTAVPAHVVPGSRDTRVLGAHFTSFRASTP
jgi:glycosyltransferase involved in cell wall biosynthesis